MTQFKVGCQHLFKGTKVTKTSLTAVSRLRFETGSTGMCYLISLGLSGETTMLATSFFYCRVATVL